MMVEYKRSVKIKTALILIVIMSIMGWIYECAFYSFSEGEFIVEAQALALGSLYMVLELPYIYSQLV